MTPPTTNMAPNIPESAVVNPNTSAMMPVRLLSPPNMALILEKENIRMTNYLLVSMSLSDFMKGSVFTVALALGGVFGLFLTVTTVHTQITDPMIASMKSSLVIYVLPISLSCLASSSTNQIGSMNPMAAPIF